MSRYVDISVFKENAIRMQKEQEENDLKDFAKKYLSPEALNPKLEDAKKGRWFRIPLSSKTFECEENAEKFMEKLKLGMKLIKFPLNADLEVRCTRYEEFKVFLVFN